MEDFRILEKLLDKVLSYQRRERREAREAAEDAEEEEEPEQTTEGAMKTNMTAEEERAVREWLEAAPARAADA
eukprot:6723032-Heterocapsa_arctica.AAC.2